MYRPRAVDDGVVMVENKAFVSHIYLLYFDLPPVYHMWKRKSTGFYKTRRFWKGWSKHYGILRTPHIPPHMHHQRYVRKHALLPPMRYALGLKAWYP